MEYTFYGIKLKMVTVPTTFRPSAWLQRITFLVKLAKTWFWKYEKYERWSCFLRVHTMVRIHKTVQNSPSIQVKNLDIIDDSTEEDRKWRNCIALLHTLFKEVK